MNLKNLMWIVCAASCAAACSNERQPHAPAGELATEADCRQMVEKGLEHQGAPPGSMGELLNAGTKACVDSGDVTKDDYRCVMSASSPSESRACNLVF
jgi:hypothetical protein